MTVKLLPPEIYYRDIPKRHMSAAGVIFNAYGELLIVKLSYKESWEMPGGITDHGETVRETALREICEELGINVTLKNLLCVDMQSTLGVVPENIEWIFEVETLSAQQIADIRIDHHEIIDYGFFPVTEALAKLNPNMAKRVAQALAARELQVVLYLENGDRPFRVPDFIEAQK